MFLHAGIIWDLLQEFIIIHGGGPLYPHPTLGPNESKNMHRHVAYQMLGLSIQIINM